MEEVSAFLFKMKQWEVLGLDSRLSWPPPGARASTLNGFVISAENWKEVSFKLRGIVLLSTRCCFLKKYYFTRCFNVFRTISEKFNF